MKDGLYRKAALQNLSVAERLDTAVQVVTPATSLVIVAAGAAIVTAIVWALIGHVPSRVYGDGMLFRQGSIVDVTSMADGQVQRVVVSVGAQVHENDPIAYVDQPELKTQRSLLEVKLTELQRKYAQLAALDEQGVALKHNVFNQQRAAVAFVLTETRKQLDFYRGKLKADNRLLEQGLTTPAAVAETRAKVLDLENAIHEKQTEGGTIAFNALESKRALEERKYDLSMRVSETKRDLEELDKRIGTQSIVVAKASGRIIEIKVNDGDAVSRGRSVATLEVSSSEQAELTAVVYLPVSEGKRVKAGMPIQLSPSVVKPEEDGYIDGIVDSVSPFPVSAQSVLRTVRNQNFVDALLKDGPVYEAHVIVRSDPTTPSGLHWSNGRGPQITIASGTPVHGLVTVRLRRPIELVIPAMERIVTDTPADASGS
jgi:HlyD family secretion protein